MIKIDTSNEFFKIILKLSGILFIAACVLLLISKIIVFLSPYWYIILSAIVSIGFGFVCVRYFRRKKAMQYFRRKKTVNIRLLLPLIIFIGAMVSIHFLYAFWYFLLPIMVCLVIGLVFIKKYKIKKRNIIAKDYRKRAPSFSQTSLKNSTIKSENSSNTSRRSRNYNTKRNYHSYKNNYNNNNSKISIQHRLAHKNLTEKQIDILFQKIKNLTEKQIDILFQKINALSSNSLSELEATRKEQSFMFTKINEQLRRLKLEPEKDWKKQKYCKYCGKEVTTLQKVCEICGGEL